MFKNKKTLFRENLSTRAHFEWLEKLLRILIKEHNFSPNHPFQKNSIKFIDNVNTYICKYIFNSVYVPKNTFQSKFINKRPFWVIGETPHNSDKRS